MSSHTTQSSHKLISGEFSSDDAKTILMALINNKIQFHQLERWSGNERLGADNPVVSRRIEELMQTKEALAALIEESEAKGARLAIHCSIDITMLENAAAS